MNPAEDFEDIMSNDPQTPRNDHDDDRQQDQRPRLLQILHSIMAALFGVQSGANRERDFKQGKAGDYIGVFVVAVSVLVIVMFLIVGFVISSATGG